MLQNSCKTLGLKKNMVYEIPPGGGKPYPVSGLYAIPFTDQIASLDVHIDDSIIYYL